MICFTDKVAVLKASLEAAEVAISVKRKSDTSANAKLTSALYEKQAAGWRKDLKQ